MGTRNTAAILLATIALLVTAEVTTAATETNSPATAPGFFKRLFCRLTFSETVAVVESPKEACAAVRRNLEYREDLGDNWASAEETWEKKGGDCEDLAKCVVELCERKGFKAWIEVFCAKGTPVAHAVAMGYDADGDLWLSSNGWFQKVKSISEAKEVIAREMRWKNKEVLNSRIENFRKLAAAATS
ncbi:MAG: hypothetical protein C0404_03190 [Verrucomicrobia bacterium]|nr:hypothetical protein [Verrucomicrobiota bacterium]